MKRKALCRPNDRKDALLLPSKSGPCSRQETLSGLQERIKSLKLAMEKAKGILRVPDLEQYCALDTVVMFACKDGNSLRFYILASSWCCSKKCSHRFWRHSEHLLTRNPSETSAAVWTLDLGFTHLLSLLHIVSCDYFLSECQHVATIMCNLVMKSVCFFLSCIFYSEILNQNDSLLLKMEVTTSPVRWL